MVAAFDAALVVLVDDVLLRCSVSLNREYFLLFVISGMFSRAAPGCVNRHTGHSNVSAVSGQSSNSPHCGQKLGPLRCTSVAEIKLITPVSNKGTDGKMEVGVIMNDTKAIVSRAVYFSLQRLRGVWR
jgi:hypothetical protein